MVETRRFQGLEPGAMGQPAQPHRSVALQVEFERQILKPVFHLIGFRL
jgi:hypothetical protein